MTWEDYTNHLLASFDPAEVETIRNRAVPSASGEFLDAIALAASWEAHVAKIDNDRSLDRSNRTVWNEFDLVAALIMRDYLEKSLQALPPLLREKMSTLAAPVDDRFRGYTVPDSGVRIARIGDIDLEGRGWWWFRVPGSGPIAEDLARHGRQGLQRDETR